MKKCVNCGERKPATNEYFQPRKDSKDGFRGECRSCLADRLKLYNISNKESLSITKKLWQEAHREDVIKRKRAYYQDNKSIITRNKKIYYEANKAATLETQRKYLENNRADIIKWQAVYRQENDKLTKKYQKEYRKSDHGRGVRAVCGQRRNAIKHLLPSTFTPQQWEEAKAYFNNRCAYCNADAPLAQDHFLSLSRHSGPYDQSNILPSCRSCNSSKGSKSYSEWHKYQSHYTPEREQKILNYLGYSKQGIQQLSLL